MQYLKITMLWNIYYISLVLFSASLIQQVSSEDLSSCAGRCGEGYSREAACHCDYSCLHYMECCHDYKKFCTEELSCKGRCFETFVRGRECDCDADCEKYGKCCPDYQKHCEEALTTKSSSTRTTPLVTKTTAKRSSKNSKNKKPKKVVQSHEVMEEHSESEKQKSSSSSSSSLSTTTIRKTKASSKNPNENGQTKDIKNKNNRKAKDAMKEKDSKNRRTTADKIREISEEIGSGLENVGTRPAPTTKHPNRKILREGNKATTAAPLSEENFRETPASQPHKTTMTIKMNTTKILTPKTSMPPTTTTSTTKISALTNAAHVTKAKDKSTTSMKNATPTTTKGATIAKKNTSIVTTTIDKETIAQTDKTVTAITESQTVTTAKPVTTAAAKDTVKTTAKKDATTIAKKDTTTVNDIIFSPDEKDVMSEKGTTTAAKNTVTRAPRTDTTTEIKDTVTTTGRKDTTIVDKEKVTTKVLATTAKESIMTTAKLDTTTATKKTPTAAEVTTVATDLTNERETTTVSDEVITLDEKDLTKKHTTTAARKTVTRAPRTSTTAEIKDTEPTARKRDITIVNKENMPTGEKDKSTTDKKDTTVATETMMSTDERDTKDAKKTITAKRETATTTKTVTTGSAKDTVTSATKKDASTAGEEIRPSPYEKSLMPKKDTTAAYREIESSPNTATTAAARETVTRSPRTDTTIDTKDTLATTGKKDTSTVDKESVMTIDTKDTTTIAEVNIMTTGEKDTTGKDTTFAYREIVTTKVTATAAKESIMTTAKLDTTTATKKTQTATKQTPTAAEITAVATDLTTADKEETEDNRQKTTATKQTTEAKKELTAVIKGTTTEKASDDKEVTTTDKKETPESTVTKETLTVSEEVSTIAKDSQERPVSPTQDGLGTTVTQIPPVKATAKPSIEPEKKANPAIEITATAPINLTTSNPKDFMKTKVHFETTKETSTVTKRSVTTSISKGTTETKDISENAYTRDTATQKNTEQSPTDRLQTSKIIISPSLTQKPAANSVPSEQENHRDNSSPTPMDPMTVADSNFPGRNTENPKEPNQNPTSPKQEDSIDSLAISFTTCIAPLKGTLNPNGNNEYNWLETITKITQTTTKSNSAISQKQETTSHGITTSNSTDLVSDKAITKENQIAMNTNTSVKHTIGTSISAAVKDMHYTSTLANGFRTTRPEERKEDPHFPTKTYSISYSTNAPERTPTIQANSTLQKTINTTFFYKGEQDDNNLCNGKPADGIVALPNGTLAVFRGHYYWLLDSAKQPTVSPRKITEGWGIPSPIDTVFSRCNCDGKTFFFKGSQYWRFTNDVKDMGYPKQIAKGFAGLNGKIVAVLSVAQHRNRPESVYFFKRGGNVQHYVYNQEPAKKCKKKVYVRYPAYTPRAVIKRRRFERAIRSAVVYRTPVMSHTIRLHHNPSGILHHEVKINSYWRGFPKVVRSAISIPNYQRPDGYDYYVFSKDQYYNVDVASRIARSVTAQTGQTVSNDWYKCPKEDV
ncbi:proteoglycan 4 isoform X1 [Pelodiscus sinensis]|uniref:proteoglycan 4 isoform X1 n=1 Tax=Pelodiscus sinensis TaxID=13735 RepID=UPI003F6B610A